MWSNLQETAYLVTLNEKIQNEKLYFLCIDHGYKLPYHINYFYHTFKDIYLWKYEIVLSQWSGSSSLNFRDFIVGLRPAIATLLKRDSDTSVFPANFAKCLKTPFFIEHLLCLLLWLIQVLFVFLLSNFVPGFLSLFSTMFSTFHCFSFIV